MGMRDVLRERIAEGEVVVIVGAGVSLAATGDQVAGWTGLIDDGIGRLQSRATTDDARADARIAQDLRDRGHLVRAADQLRDCLGPDYETWLTDTVGSLRVTDPTVPRALGALQVPLLTTNYDLVLEHTLDRRSDTWQDGMAWAQANAGGYADVLHIHGHWKRPQSVVFDTASYTRLVVDRTNQHLLRTLATTKHLLFVGVGAGMDDANIAGLREFVATVLADVPVEHYQLVREQERSSSASIIDGRVTQVVYGRSHEDLASYLQELAPPAPVEARAEEAVEARAKEAVEAPVLDLQITGGTVVATQRVGGRVEKTEALDHQLTPLHLETIRLLDERLRDHAAPGTDGNQGEWRRYALLQIGRILFESIFPGRIAEMYQALRRASFSIHLDVTSAAVGRLGNTPPVEIGDLPWELLWEKGAGYLAATPGCTLSRTREWSSTPAWQPVGTLRVLVALLQPHDIVERMQEQWQQQARDYDREVCRIIEAIGEAIAEDRGHAKPDPMSFPRAADEPVTWDRLTAPVGDDDASPTRFAIEPVVGAPEDGSPDDDPRVAFPLARHTAVTWDVFRDAVKERGRFDVVHLIGHASKTGQLDQIAFGTAGRSTEWVAFHEVSELFRELSSDDRPTLIFLHLCQGPPQGPDRDHDLMRATFNKLAYELLDVGVPVVVAMQYPMHPDVGRKFTKSFYKNVAQSAVAEAVQEARSVTKTPGPVGPVLYLGGPDGAILTRRDLRPTRRREATPEFSKTKKGKGKRRAKPQPAGDSGFDPGTRTSSDG